MTIESADDFFRLRTSEIKEEYDRASWDDASNEVWLATINDYPDMREWVAHNKSIPDEIKRILAGDDSLKVRLTIAMKRALPLDIFICLSKDKEETIRRQIALNPKVPLHILKILTEDESSFVRETAKQKFASRT